jgi:RNA-directed DNA polymerase
MTILRDRRIMSTKLSRIAELAKQNKELKFLSIAHLLTVEAMERAFVGLQKKASAGVDGITYAQYEEGVRGKLEKLHERLKSGRYRAQPLRRSYIPKQDGRLRPIGIPALEDKVVQKATVELLSAIYEQDFLGCSYGSRPRRGAHDALDEIGRVICQCPISYVVEADICGYLDTSLQYTSVHEWASKRVGC